MEKKRKKSGFKLMYRFQSIQTAMIVSFGVLIVLALLVFLMISLHYTENTILDNSQDYTMQLVEQVNQEIDSYITYMENISQMVTGTENSDVKEYLFGDGDNDTVLRQRILGQFAAVMETRADILNIAVAADNGRTLVNDGDMRLNPYVDLKEMPWYQATIKAGGTAVVSSSHVQNAVENCYKWVVTLSKALLNPQNGKVEGVFFIDLNYSTINNLCEKISLEETGYLFIVDKEGSIIYHPKQKLLLAGLKSEYTDEVRQLKNGSFTTSEGNESKLYTVCSSDETGWTIAGVSYIRELMKDQDQTQMIYLLSALALFTLAMILSVLLSRTLTRPLTELKESMEEVQKGHFDNATFETEGKNEIVSLGRSFNIMTDRIQKLMEENVQEQKQKRKSELRALQSQVNPHFLYNTLDSIIWMAEWGKNQEVVLMTSALARLLRQSISNEDEVVTIEKEMEYTRSYLTIQKMRYRDQLEFEIDVDREILDKDIVKLVVQPLVENAIYHGIKYLDGKGMIWITGVLIGKNIVLSVRDNGIGMEEETLSHILEKKPLEEAKKHNGVGVYNVHNRLQLHYGKEFGLSFESAPGIGTTAFIIVPDLKQEVNRNEEA